LYVVDEGSYLTCCDGFSTQFIIVIIFVTAEKKLLQSKLREVSTDDKVDAKKTSIGTDVSTSTEDLGMNQVVLLLCVLIMWY